VPAALFYIKPPAQKNVIEGIGIGAGGISLFSGRLDPKTAAAAYRTAAAQLNCVGTALAPVVTAPGGLDRNLNQHMFATSAAATVAGNAIGVAGVTDSTKAGFDAEAKIASSALQVASQIRDAYANGATYAVSEIQAVERTLSQALDKQTITYATALSQIQQAATVKAANAGNTTAAAQIHSRALLTMPAGGGGGAPGAAPVLTADQAAVLAINELHGQTVALQLLNEAYPLQDTHATIQGCIGKSPS
jgi:hypothetical protein